jgi:glycerol-3-phosphate O-acyltransferase
LSNRSGQSRISLYRWLRTILELWVRARAVPDTKSFWELGIDLKKPICYVLKTNSIFDLLILDIHCRKNKLPRPIAVLDNLGTVKDAASVYLSEVGVLRTYSSSRNEPPSPFFKLLRRAQAESDFDVQLIPVSVFWGRDPGRGEPSVFKLLFPDDDRAGFFQKLLIVVAQGKDVVLNYSRPIMLREQLLTSPNIEQTARKIKRVVRVHFQTLRLAVLGPGLISRNRVTEALIRSKSMREAIDEECRKKNLSRDEIEKQARGYVSEIAAEVSLPVISGMAIILRRLWNRLYNGVQVENIDRLKNLPANAEVVYVPCHRSHIDYLLLNYVLYEHRLVTPHVAAGINLNFWPIGSLFRRLGAFYIRRTFKNNRLYSAAFSEYVSFLLQRGFPLQFFPEGGRSRTGKLLKPKTGMLSMVVTSFLRNQERPIRFVPVYIGYDRVAEVITYRRELSGSKKKTESVGQLVRGRKALRSSHGRAYLAFAEAIDLEKVLDKTHPSWSDHADAREIKPAWLNPAVQALASQIMTSINEVAVVGPVSIVALILLASRQRSLPEEELLLHVDLFIKLTKLFPYTSDVKIPDMSSREILQAAESLAGLTRFTHPSGDMIHALEPKASYLLYYRNNIAHLFALPSLVAFFLQHNDSISESTIREGTKAVYPMLKKEFFLRWSEQEIDQAIAACIDAFIQMGLFSRESDSTLVRPQMTKVEFNFLRTLGLVVGPAIERFAIATQLLSQHSDGVPFGSVEFQTRCALMAQRLSLLSGSSDIELSSSQVFTSVIEQLHETRVLMSAGEDQWKVTEDFSRILHLTNALLSADMRQSIARSGG